MVMWPIATRSSLLHLENPFTKVGKAVSDQLFIRIRLGKLYGMEMYGLCCTNRSLSYSTIMDENAVAIPGFSLLLPHH